MLIASGKFTHESLAGKVAIVTGAGGGIGFEAARSLIWLGAKVILAEINKASGRDAEERLNHEFGDGFGLFVHSDIGDERSVNALSRHSIKKFGRVDIVINNATLAPLGAVKEVPIDDWDRSYRVNLRGPVLMARVFVPGMIDRGYGVFVCVSSLGQEFMAAYEAVKAAQVHLAGTLDAELNGTGVVAFAIGPGYVPTQTAEESIPRLAALMGKPADELFAIVSEHKISVEAAGAGFAAAVLLAEQYRGQEVSSLQALIDAGIDVGEEQKPSAIGFITAEQFAAALEVCRRVRTTLADQSAGWKERSIFEQQWLVRSFKNRAGMTVEQWLVALEQLASCLEAQDAAALNRIRPPLGKLASYYRYLYDTAQGYIKDPAQREEYLAIVLGWVSDVEQLDAVLSAKS